jgi:hypothetical protein
MALSLMGTVEQSVQLTTAQQVKLRKELKLKAQYDREIKALEAKKKAAVAAISVIREESGLDTFELDGFTVTLVAPVREVLDHKALIALGCKVEWIEKATKLVPTEPYTKVTAPK